VVFFGDENVTTTFIAPHRAEPIHTPKLKVIAPAPLAGIADRLGRDGATRRPLLTVMGERLTSGLRGGA
jgi:hypothetical protein